MNVYTYLDPNGPDIDIQLIPLWEESWRRNGWTPRLLTIRDAKRHPDYRGQDWPGLIAFAQVGGGWYSTVKVMNFSFVPRREKTSLVLCEGGVVWASPRAAEERLRSYPPNFPLSYKFRGDLISSWRVGFEVSPLVSFSRCQALEEVQQGIESCLQAQKNK